MKNWTQRLAVRVVFGILILGAMLAGCSSNQATSVDSGTNINTDSSGKPIDLANQGKPGAAGAPKGDVPTDSAGNPINPR